MDGQMDGWMGADMDISEYILTRISIHFSMSLYICIFTSIHHSERWRMGRRMLSANCSDRPKCSQQASKEGSIKIIHIRLRRKLKLREVKVTIWPRVGGEA